MDRILIILLGGGKFGSFCGGGYVFEPILGEVGALGVAP